MKGLNYCTSILIAPGVVASGPVLAASEQQDEDVSQANIYLFGRLLVARQQQLDFQDGFKWNEIVHREPGKVDWPNPNLDVAYSEAWLAVDETSCTIATVPEIKDRYFTVQILNGWGETLANINERVFPSKSSGDFTICLRDAKVDLPHNVTSRIDLPVKQARVLIRVALGDDWDKAVAYQHQFTFKATGSPTVQDIAKTPVFPLETLPGVEAFEAVAAALDSEPDLNPGQEPLAETARAIRAAIKDPTERARIDKVIRDRGFADFAKAGPPIGHGTVRNGWARPATVGVYNTDYLARTLINYGGIWANIAPEVMYSASAGRKAGQGPRYVGGACGRR
ncbi:DUF1254 domain-containing protein [Shinella sp.]|uniref:DUF1254 domain-containing protein n=1 Tax=Shinella sp. TaxID=1870904 RepID=UPI003F70B582